MIIYIDPEIKNVYCNKCGKKIMLSQNTNKPILHSSKEISMGLICPECHKKEVEKNDT